MNGAGFSEIGFDLLSFHISGVTVFPVYAERIFDVRLKFRELLNVSSTITHAKRSLNSEFL